MLGWIGVGAWAVVALVVLGLFVRSLDDLTPEEIEKLGYLGFFLRVVFYLVCWPAVLLAALLKRLH